MQITLKMINVQGNRIDYDYEYDEALSPFFSNQHQFSIEYLQTELDFRQVPLSLLTVPFAANVLPLCFMENVVLCVPTIDKDFAESIDKIREGFSKIYPEMTFGGRLEANTIENNSYEPSEHTVCLFSGGVDAMYTTLVHRQERPTMVNVWGIDIRLDDTEGYEIVQAHCRKAANTFDLPYICVRSTLRVFLNESYLNSVAYRKLHDYWWHGAQHSIGLLSVLAPYNYIKKTRVNYIASSFTEKEFHMGVKCASFPVVDESLRFGGTVMCHDGFEVQRIDKVRYISEVFQEEKLSLELKVCFRFEKGENCSACEKCFRTMMAILIYDEDLSRYGFAMAHKDARNIRWFLQRNQIGIFRWEPIQRAYLAHNQNKNIRWFARFRFNETKSLRSKILRGWAKVERFFDR